MYSRSRHDLRVVQLPHWEEGKRATDGTVMKRHEYGFQLAETLWNDPSVSNSAYVINGSTPFDLIVIPH